ncbi:RdgB/HAM1 family non-canonical purine NTP pyrophosphatase [Segetibacter sp. 3557_3]|uniref:RdgB/HAM1 family non-canonical purine NTP pyrophosphatase n=1 Tax=Segetibacter sp. 3557_3 TaxID=2547429 RepID=UPI001A9F38EB|nr:RdgB/HAM1 family non-canonical purine NTP pyrophosphatase [Segetibacter sp. 3557_3]
MRTIVFATNNPNKVEEVRAIVGREYHIISLKDAGIHIDIPEPHDTLEKNAAEKSGTIYRLTGSNCFSEDTGLEVEALNGVPGVKSARYAGEHSSSTDNVNKLLAELADTNNRKARFRTIISLIFDGKEHQFEGVCNGTITLKPSGDAGFGYDPVFIPDGASATFAEMTLDEKNRFSHRKKAMRQLLSFLSLAGK